MTDNISDAVQLLRIAADQDENKCIDSQLDEQQTIESKSPTRAELKAQLEAEYLTPSKTFGPEWLNKFQR